MSRYNAVLSFGATTTAVSSVLLAIDLQWQTLLTALVGIGWAVVVLFTALWILEPATESAWRQRPWMFLRRGAFTPRSVPPFAPPQVRLNWHFAQSARGPMKFDQQDLPADRSLLARSAMIVLLIFAGLAFYAGQFEGLVPLASVVALNVIVVARVRIGLRLRDWAAHQFR